MTLHLFRPIGNDPPSGLNLLCLVLGAEQVKAAELEQLDGCSGKYTQGLGQVGGVKLEQRWSVMCMGPLFYAGWAAFTATG